MINNTNIIEKIFNYLENNLENKNVTPFNDDT